MLNSRGELLVFEDLLLVFLEKFVNTALNLILSHTVILKVQTILSSAIIENFLYYSLNHKEYHNTPSIQKDHAATTAALPLNLDPTTTTTTIIDTNTHTHSKTNSSK